MRSRQIISIERQTATPLYEVWNSCAQTSYTLLSTLAGPYVGTWEYMSDVVVPNYHRRSSRGEVFFNPMSRDVHRVACEGIGYEQQIKISNITCTGVPRFKMGKRDGDQPAIIASVNLYSGATLLQAPRVISDSDVASAIREVSTKVLSDRGSADTNFYETLAELDQTLGLQKSIIDEIRKIVESTKRTKLGRAAKSAAALYLLYRYGIRPLIGDIGALASSMGLESKKVRKTTRGSIHLNQQEYTSQNFGTGIVYVVGTQKTEDVTIRAMSLDEYTMSSVTESGLGTKELMKLPWELVPFSFVLDWFANVGDFYGSFLPTPGYTQLGSCVVTERTTSCVHNVTSFTQPSYAYNMIRPCTGSLTLDSTRKIRAGLMAPGLVIKSDFRFSNLTRCADALALLLQRMRFK